MSDHLPADRSTAPRSAAASGGPPAPSGRAPAPAPHPEQARLVVRGAVFTVVMIAVGFAGTTARAGIETGLVVHLLRSLIVACALGTMAGLLALPVLAARRGWRPWMRPVLVATCVPALVLGLALLLARATA